MNMFWFTIMSHPTSGVRNAWNISFMSIGIESKLGIGIRSASMKAMPFTLDSLRMA